MCINRIIRFISRSCLFFVLLFSTTIPAEAQVDLIYELPIITPADAIIRHWKGQNYIVYNRKDGFFLIDASTLSCREFNVMLSGVKDFEIAGDTVYFCGKDASAPFFGYFDIPTLFSVGTGMYMSSLSMWSTSMLYPPYQERITDLMKLTVHPCPDGVHVYMIGRAEFTGSTSTNRCIVDMRYYGSTWFCEYAQEQASVYHYDDITVTDNEVVVIGHKNGSAGYYNSSYVNSNTAGVPLINIPPPYTATYYSSGGSVGCVFDVNKPLMIEHLFGDFYAIVGHASLYSSKSSDHGTVIDIYNTSANFISRYYVSQGFADTASLLLRDFRYNKDSRRLYLLQEMSNPVSASVNSVMCVFDVTAAGTITSAMAYWQSDTSYNSLDQCYNIDEAAVIGGKKSMLLWRHQLGGDCVRKEILPLNTFEMESHNSTYPQYPISIRPTFTELYGNLIEHRIKKICGER